MLFIRIKTSQTLEWGRGCSRAWDLRYWAGGIIQTALACDTSIEKIIYRLQLGWYSTSLNNISAQNNNNYLFNGNTWSAGCAIIIRWNFVDEVVSGAVFCALFITIRNVLLTSIMLKFKDKPALFSVLDNNPKDSIKWLWLKTCEKLSPWSESSLLIVELCKEWNPARRHMTHTHCHHQQPALVPSISFYWNHIWFSFRKISWRYQLSIIQVLPVSYLQLAWKSLRLL